MMRVCWTIAWGLCPLWFFLYFLYLVKPQSLVENFVYLGIIAVFILAQILFGFLALASLAKARRRVRAR